MQSSRIKTKMTKNAIFYENSVNSTFISFFPEIPLTSISISSLYDVLVSSKRFKAPFNPKQTPRVNDRQESCIPVRPSSLCHRTVSSHHSRVSNWCKKVCMSSNGHRSKQHSTLNRLTSTAHNKADWSCKHPYRLNDNMQTTLNVHGERVDKCTCDSLRSGNYHFYSFQSNCCFDTWRWIFLKRLSENNIFTMHNFTNEKNKIFCVQLMTSN